MLSINPSLGIKCVKNFEIFLFINFSSDTACFKIKLSTKNSIFETKNI